LYDYRDFTYDKEGSFANLSNFVDGLHKKNMQWIPIIDAGIAARSNPQ
jgi:alpha-glucosidase (family GH31 glycosyl hydrolase)